LDEQTESRFPWPISLAIITVSIFLFFLTVHPVIGYAQTYTDLHDFNCEHDGCGPNLSGIVAQGTDGNLYGTLPDGGAGCGSVFRITPSAALNDVYNFSGGDGCNPFRWPHPRNRRRLLRHYDQWRSE
jgi:hypothetical protein